MKIKIKFLAFLLMLFTFSALNAMNPPDSVFRAMRDTTTFKLKLKAYSSSFKGMESEFTQYKKMKMLKKPVISNGNFYYRDGNQVRWEYTRPFVYIIVINNGKIYIKDETKTNQYDMTANQTFMQMNGKLSSMVDGSLLDDHKDFRVRYSENDAMYRVELTPLNKDLKGFFNTITLSFEKADLSIARINMSEKNGDITEIKFHHKKINKPISDERFIIK